MFKSSGKRFVELNTGFTERNWNQNQFWSNRDFQSMYSNSTKNSLRQSSSFFLIERNEIRTCSFCQFGDLVGHRIASLAEIGYLLLDDFSLNKKNGILIFLRKEWDLCRSGILNLFLRCTTKVFHLSSQKSIKQPYNNYLYSDFTPPHHLETSLVPQVENRWRRWFTITIFFMFQSLSGSSQRKGFRSDVLIQGSQT